MVVNSPEELWSHLRSALAAATNDATIHAWLSAVYPVSFSNDTLSLVTGSSLVKEHFERILIDRSKAHLTGLLGRPVHVAIALDPSFTPSPPQDPGAPEHQQRDLVPPPDDPERFTFENFVIGPSNRFAHAAALSVAEAPGRSYNPLFIHGGVGLGKTHLLRAIQHYVRQHYSSLKVRYVSTETFLSEFVDAIRTNTPTQFKRRYRECDLLLIDDIQFLEGREGLQEEFFHTFNTLYEASKQVVLSSDRPPRALATIEERLKSRFMSGLITDVQPPDFETRLAILRMKADRAGTRVPDDLLALIAENITDNIRQLEGALTRIIANIHLNGTIPSVSEATQLLADLFSGPASPPITPERIIDATAAVFGVTPDQILGHERKKPLVIARQVGMYVTRHLTDYSYPAIAKAFGGRDHTTVIHAVERVADLLKHDRHLYNQVNEIIKLSKGLM
jgi:chromosomal replication initiator protein